MARNPEYLYIVSDNDELELQRLVTDKVGEVAEFLGISVKGVHVHFERGFEKSGTKKDRYLLRRYRKEEMARCKA